MAVSLSFNFVAEEIIDCSVDILTYQDVVQMINRNLTTITEMLNIGFKVIDVTFTTLLHTKYK